MMNTEVAKKLNGLLEASKKGVIGKGPGGADFGPRAINLMSLTTEDATNLAERIAGILESHLAAVQHDEILAAAREKRVAKILDGEMRSYAVDSNPRQYWTVRELFDVAVRDVQAAIDADNKRREEAYERYRVACEQGVAVPPE